MSNRQRFSNGMFQRPAWLKTPLAFCLLSLGGLAIADSYEPFHDLVEVDRQGYFFSEARREREDATNRQVTITVWTRLAAGGEEKLSTFGREGRDLPAAAMVSPGPIRTVFETELDFHPDLIRLSSTALAILGYNGSDYGDLKRGPAVQVTSFDKHRSVSFALDQIFQNGVERYHDGRGKVFWLRDAWFDASGRRLVIVSEAHSSNRHGFETAFVSIDDGTVQLADAQAIGDLLAEADDRFLHRALEIGTRYPVKGIEEIARKVLSNPATTLQAKLRAAAFLWKEGDVEAGSLVREIAALGDHDLEAVTHPLLSPTMVFDGSYWWETVGYASSVCEEMNAVGLPSVE